MSICVACEAEMDVDEFDVDRGDTLSCPECGANLEVVAVSPVELELTSDEDDGLGLSEDEEDEKETDAEEDFE